MLQIDFVCDSPPYILGFIYIILLRFLPIACTCGKTKAICHFLFSFRFGFFGSWLRRCELANNYWVLLALFLVPTNCSWAKAKAKATWWHYFDICLLAAAAAFVTFAFQMTVNYPLSTLPASSNALVVFCCLSFPPFHPPPFPFTFCFSSLFSRSGPTRSRKMKLIFWPSEFRLSPPLYL